MGIVTDPYTFSNGTVADALQVNARIAAILAQLNGNVDSNNIADGSIQLVDLAAALQTTLGVGVTSRGKSIITTPETRTNVALGLMPTPDRVSGLVLPASGLMVIAYQATWQESVVAAGEAAIFLGANQLRYQTAGLGGAPNLQSAKIGTAAANTDSVLSSFFGGLTSRNLQAGAQPHSGDVTTGQIIGTGSQSSGTTVVDQGGVCWVFAAAGTYDVSVQFRSSSGSVTAKDRKLWVWTMGF